MAAIDFPSSPSVNQVFTANNTSWQWDGTTWVAYEPTSGNFLFSAGTLDAGVVSAGTNTVIPTTLTLNTLPPPAVTSGTTIISNGTAWVAQQPSANVQTFLNSGTWTKPLIGQFVRVQMWGGGGGGNRNGTSANVAAGGGGGYYEFTVPIASMGATATVTVGAAGVGRKTTAGVGTNGGNSGVTLGNGLTVYVSGGGGGDVGAGGFGGYGGILFSTTAYADQTVSPPTGANIGAGGSSGGSAPQAGYSYTGGGGAVNTSLVGGAGGWGGGGGSRGANAGGTSMFGGTGGTFNTDGTQPGGGGGCAGAANTDATDGGAGQVIITTY
jgi:hypothetical protein